MDVIVGIAIAGPVVAPERVGLGRPVWNPHALLRDLELRVGLPPSDESNIQRLPPWTARMRAAATPSAFYWRSFLADEIGTATRLLEWRDLLIEAGWNAQRVGDERVDALADIEQTTTIPLPLGRSDRLLAVDRELACHPGKIYDRVSLLDPRELWPGRWQRVFDRLAELGTAVEPHIVEKKFDHLRDESRRSDLALLQARLRGEHTTERIRGDGSLLLLRGDTPNDLAELTASLLHSVRESSNVVARLRDVAPLDAALTRFGLPAQGWTGRSTWRPAMQLLALALELAFEPRDPNRVLELLTLSVGPFRGLLGAKLARAVARQPGVGGKEWTRQKADAAVRLRAQAAGDAKATNAAELRLERVSAWLERPGAVERIRRAELQSVIERVQTWLHGRLAGDEADVYLPAYAQTAAFADLIRHDARASFSREDVRQLFDTFARTEHEYELTIESSGRASHVHHPSSLLGPCDNLFVWNFVGGIERLPRRLPWSDVERKRLSKSGIQLPDPTTALRADADAWRRSALAPKERLVLVAPSTIAGVASPIHPFWDEIHARLLLDDGTVARITLTPRAALDGHTPLARTRAIPALPLPEGRANWSIPAELLVGNDRRATTSVSALERFASCPLAWALEHRAAVVSGAMSRVARGGLLNGTLAHRLVEILHRDRSFELPEESFLLDVDTRFEELLRTEGATLLLPGASVERLQLTRQIRTGMRALYRFLVDNDFRIAEVEEEITTTSAIGPIHGRIDLRLVDARGNNAILDLKWGGSEYSELLGKGRSVQLAVYARALGGDTPAGYFALARGALLSTDSRLRSSRIVDGPSLADTWRRVEATAASVLEAHSRGTLHVPAAKAEIPLLERLGIAPGERENFYDSPPSAPCKYCDYDALCGRKWRSFA